MTAKRTEPSYFPLGAGPMLGREVYAGLVLGQPGTVLVARCPHQHSDVEDAQRCARDIAHVATLPGELQSEWLDRHSRPRVLPSGFRDLPAERQSEMRATAAAGAERRRAGLLAALDAVHAYLDTP